MPDRHGIRRNDEKICRIATGKTHPFRIRLQVGRQVRIQVFAAEALEHPNPLAMPKAS